MSSSDAAVLEEIARLTNAIDRHKSGDTQPPSQYNKRLQSSWRPPYAPKFNAHNSKAYKPYPPVQQPPREVVIDGVTFQSKGKSLVRKTAQQEGQSTPSQPGSVSTPIITEPSGSSTSKLSPVIQPQPLIRVRNGLVAANLYKKPPSKPPVSARRTAKYPNSRLQGKRSSKFHKNRTLTMTQKKKPEKQCPRFTMHGICSYGLTCRYTHDPDKISLCPLFLKGTCPHKDDPSQCSLSHDPTPERTPVCSRFNTTGDCWKGSDCLFPHIRVGDKEGVCKDFAVYGYCEKGAQCPSNHIKECPQFAATGKCDRAGLKGPAGCSLPHVIRANRKKQGGSSTLAPVPAAVTPSGSPSMSSTSSKRKAGSQETQGPSVEAQVPHDSKRAKRGLDGTIEASSSVRAGDTEGSSRPFDSEFISLTFLESDEDDEEGEEDEDEDENESDDDDNDDDENGIAHQLNDSTSGDDIMVDDNDDAPSPGDSTHMYDN